jgi:prophage regulatory protein
MMGVSAVCYRPRRKGLNTVTGKILRLKELIAYIGLSRSVIYERMDSKSDRHDPSFPKSFALGGKAVNGLRFPFKSGVGSLPGAFAG